MSKTGNILLLTGTSLVVAGLWMHTAQAEPVAPRQAVTAPNETRTADVTVLTYQNGKLVRPLGAAYELGGFIRNETTVPLANEFRDVVLGNYQVCMEYIVALPPADNLAVGPRYARHCGRVHLEKIFANSKGHNPRSAAVIIDLPSTQ